MMLIVVGHQELASSASFRLHFSPPGLTVRIVGGDAMTLMFSRK